ncbi:MAG: TIGR03013 family XrtA/PEP-CTERM system glycosyltransferase [Pseudomonadota bacterium]|nr:TIGR03013 family XrtA/PEP-CTERM system glycosyltransferase [Pseudomonadota bacterium]
MSKKRHIPRAHFFRGKFRLFGHHIHAQFILLALLELSFLIAANYLTYRWLNSDVPRQELLKQLPHIIGISLVFIIFMVAMGLYSGRQRQSFFGVLSRIVVALLFGLATLVLISMAFPPLALEKGMLLAFALTSVYCLGILHAIFYTFFDGKILTRRILVIGTGKRASYIDELRHKTDVRGFDQIGFIAPKLTQHVHVKPERILSLGASFCDFALENDIDEIVIALDDRRQGLPTDELLNCRMSGINIIDMLNFFEREMGLLQLDLISPGWLIHADGFKRNIFRSMIKRTFDIIASGLLLIVFLPFIILTALAIFIESKGKGPILYFQERTGLNGKPFNVIKFRSMQTTAESDGQARWAETNDPRITRVGSFIRKYRLDELPQIWNVFVGEMSLVGPRPERPVFVNNLCKINPLYTERHRVKPGITGWAQLCYPYGASDKDSIEKLKYDLYYVKNHTLFFDFYIIIQTIEVVLFKKGSR